MVELLELEPKDRSKRDQRIALTGRAHPGEWYAWHGAYSAPFVQGERLYIRTFDNLYCFGAK